MPYSFTEIERKKSQTIRLVFVSLCLFYFGIGLCVYAIIKASILFYRDFFLPLDVNRGEMLNSSFAGFHLHFTLTEFLIVGFLALVLAWWHWAYTAEHMFGKILTILKAQTLKKEDPYHAMFRNILDELSVATGGRDYQGYVLPTTAMNAFAVEDFNGNAVIGLTEGLLSKLSRAQIESVVAHEAGHILRGDSLETTLTISLYRLLQEILQNYKTMLSGMFSMDDEGRGLGFSIRGGLAVIYFFFVSLTVMGLLQLTNGAGLLLNMFISRQREYRADAIAVRLSRDPQSLAESLYIISHRWRGAGLPGENLDAIFIVSPAYNTLEERLGLVADLFSTHPPVESRIGILLDMAHTDQSVLENALKILPVTKPGADFESKTWDSASAGASTTPAVNQWFVMQNEKWQGPFNLEQLMGLAWLCAGSSVKKSGVGRVMAAQDDPDVNQILKLQKSSIDDIQNQCPKCHVPFAPLDYEGALIHQCPQCSGVLVQEADVPKILARRIKTFDSRIKYLAELSKSQNKVMRKPLENYLYAQDGLVCPKCRHVKARMFRQFFNLLYKVEIDKCQFCGLIWFDKDELEILQCLYEEQSAD